MKNITKAGITVALLAAAFAVGCSSSSGGADGAVSGTAGAGGGAGVTPFGFTEGDTCFDVVSIQNVNDVCGAQPGTIVGMALPVNYVAATGTLTVGTSGSLGAGLIMFNQGTLTRANDPTDPTMTMCMWHQTDMSNVTVTADNEFDISVTEDQSMFKAACTGIPAGGMCTSTWTWHLKKGTKTPPGCM